MTLSVGSTHMQTTSLVMSDRRDKDQYIVLFYAAGGQLKWCDL
jgi:hypothetical protein